MRRNGARAHTSAHYEDARAREMECARAQVACPVAPAKRLWESTRPYLCSFCMRREMRKGLLAQDNLARLLSTPGSFLAKFHQSKCLFRPAINIRPAGFCPKVDQAGGLIVLGDVTCVKKRKICFCLLTHACFLRGNIIFKFSTPLSPHGCLMQLKYNFIRLLNSGLCLCKFLTSLLALM